MNSTKNERAFALVKDANGNIVKKQMHDLCGIPHKVWNLSAEKVLKGQLSGNFYPLDTLDVYNCVVHKVIKAHNEMPQLETASEETYLRKALRFAFLDIVKKVVAERNNQCALLNSPYYDSTDEAEYEKSEYPTSMNDHGYAPLYEAISSLESKQMRIAAWTYLNPSVNGNLLVCAKAAGVGKSRFYSTFWPKTLRALRRKLES